MTTVANVVLVVRTADCCPILFACPRGVGVAHAGWRGVAANVAVATLNSLLHESGCAVDEVRAIIGPCISGRSYEVGSEVIAGIENSGVPAEVFAEIRDGSRYADIGAAVEHQLKRQGMKKYD